MSTALSGLYVSDAGELLLWRADAPAGGAANAVETIRPAQATQRLQGGSVMVWVPGDAVTRMQVDTPLRSPRKVNEALPYLLEEDLAIAHEDAHLAWRRTANGVEADVTAYARMAAWRDALAPLGGAVLGIAADQGLLPQDRDAVLLRPGGFSAQLMDGRRFAGAVEMLPTWLDLAFGEDTEALETPREVMLYALASATPSCLEGAGWRLVPTALPAFDPAQATVLDLRQGAFAPASAAQLWWRAWRPAAALLALWLAVTWLAAVYEIRTLRAEWAMQRDAAEAVYRLAFPDERNVLLPKEQMAQRLQALRAANQLRSGDLIALMQQTQEALRRYAAGKVERIEYGADRVRFALRGVEATGLEQAFAGATGWRVKVEPGAETGVTNLVFVRRAKAEVGNEPSA